ncbi:MAG: FecR domain-containing protein [Chitinophagaceae bacterium]
MLNAEASPSEQEELNNLLSQDEALQQQYDLLVRIWKEKNDNVKDEDNVNASDTISRIISRAGIESDDAEMVIRRKRQRRRRNISLATFSLFSLAVAGWFWKNNSVSSAIIEKPVKEISITQNGSRTRSLLADGTTVWLNVGSKLFYENDFNGTTREVRLEGEAFFDVVKQSSRPFIVHTSGIDIRVLGTAFNVKSYPEDKNVETTLYRGLVQVVRHEDSLSKPIQLVPNHKLILPKQAAIETIKLSEDRRLSVKEPASPNITPIDSTKKESERIETAWVYNRIEFQGDSFEEVSKKLERWYNVTIVFTDERSKQLSVTGSFEKETVDQAFAALKVAFPINYKITNHEIFVESSK